MPAFREAVLHAAECGIPIVVVKSGISAAGARLAFSHTSSIAGTDAMYDALFARTGVIRARSIPEMQEQLELLAVWGVTAGRRLVVFSTSGGDSGMAADLADATGLQLPQPRRRWPTQFVRCCKAVLVLDGPRQGPLAGSAVEKMADALIAARDAIGVPAASASVMPEAVSARVPD